MAEIVQVFWNPSDLGVGVRVLPSLPRRPCRPRPELQDVDLGDGPEWHPLGRSTPPPRFCGRQALFSVE